ncbi:unnamed protein product [Schistocephalus solidus]|uniref:Uncharacterized protein n=1 Tax=Schistocephalus solidus TaxID=70667 RepID=A0A183SUE6_SCHSO|nr:unnamed protein product [Schistocephalus solidus]
MKTGAAIYTTKWSTAAKAERAAPKSQAPAPQMPKAFQQTHTANAPPACEVTWLETFELTATILQQHQLLRQHTSANLPSDPTMMTIKLSRSRRPPSQALISILQP